MIKLCWKTPRCASYRGVRLRGLQHTAESITNQVSVLIRRFTNAISRWCLKILIWNWYCKSQIVQGIFFTSEVFRKNGVERRSKYENTKNGHFRISLTPRSATHRGVNCTKILKKLRGVQHTAVCNTPRSQAPRSATHRRVKLRGLQHTAESKCTPRSQNRNLWESLVAFKGTIRKNPFRGKLFYHVRKDLKNFFLNC